jgi:ribosomal protein L9
VGHKGEIVSVPRHQAYYELLPSKLAVYPTEEYLEMTKKDRESIKEKPKISPYALKTKETLEKLTLEIPMNLSAEWILTPDIISIALRYNVRESYLYT